MRLQRTALTESSLPAPPEGGKGDGAAGTSPPLTSGGAQALGLNIKDLPTNSADEAKNQYLHSIIKRDYAHLNLHLVETKNAAEDLQAVSFGKADACLMDLGVASYHIQKLRITNLKTAAPTDWEKVELAMGVRDDWPLLQSIIQKTLDTISNEERDAINQRWIQLKYDPGIPRAVILRWGGMLGSGALVLFALFFFWNRSLQGEIAARKKIEEERNLLIGQLQKTLREVKTLQGFLPICAHCRKVRQDSGYWQQIEAYIQEHTEAKFSHSLCPDCLHVLYPDIADEVIARVNEQTATNSALSHTEPNPRPN